MFLAALGALLGVGLLGSPSSDADYRPPRVDQTRMVLRLPDLPPGYLNGYLGEGQRDDGLFCEAFSHSSDRPDPVARFARTYRVKGCIAAYVNLFTIPGQEPVAPVVFSGVMALGSSAAAADAWNLVPTMLGRVLFGGRPQEVKTSVRVGAQTRLFHTTRMWFPYLIRGKQKGSFLVWRSGSTVAVILAVGGSSATNDRVVAELARRQQAHIRKPTRYTGSERFDGDVPLDDPAVNVPAYWLGRNFRPGGDLPDNRLFASGFSEEATPETHEGFAEGPYAPLNVLYENIRLGIWTPATWHVFTASKTSRAITAWKCTRTKTIPLAEGTATIYGGFKENFRRCPKEAPKAFTAWVDVGGVKVVVNAPPAPDFIETVNPYGSFKGMAAIVRSLRLRPKPVYATTGESP
ncbi:MAG TPA: hypothetical protein VFM51_00070 [Solirubrobacterales bacterium]|nr:hypothetical protein [Solirubrobacterales bacterium]